MSNSVLIIDGDPTFAEHAQNALQHAGLTVHTRMEPSVDDIRALRPRVLVLSAELPRGSGFGICSRIRRDKALQSQLILMTTAEASDEAIARHAKSEEAANDYFRKDVAIDRLVDRVGRLLSQAPTVMISDQGGPSSENGGPTTDRMAALPPPLPAREASAAERTPSTPVIPMSGGSVAILDLWPKEAYETEFIQILGTMDIVPLSRSRSNPEDRLTQLRQMVKQHETREKAVRRLWSRVMGHGQVLARRLVTLSAELADQQESIAAAIAARDVAEKEKASVNAEFRRFEEEIRRIFSDKDVEEQAVRAELDALRTAHAEITDDLEKATEHRDDDKRRLAFLQEELDSQIVDKEEAINALQDRVKASEAENKALKAQLKSVQKDAETKFQASEHRHEETLVVAQ
ncbi:MAG: response regulator, partial [Myxococcota bacterium]